MCVPGAGKAEEGQLKGCRTGLVPAVTGPACPPTVWTLGNWKCMGLSTEVRQTPNQQGILGQLS